MALGRITGPLLKANLLRQGVNLAFETDLLYLDVVNGRIGIKTTTPSTDLDINGTGRATDLTVTNQANIATFTISGDTIASSSSVINLTPSGTNPVVYQGTIVTGDLQLSTNVIETTGTNTDLVIETTGTGEVNVNSNMFVDGNLHATGTITADGNIQIGDTNTDGITFNADITSNLTPNTDNLYDLGTDPALGGQAWRTTYTNNIIADVLTANNIIGNGIELTTTPGNTWFVSANGNDTYTGSHEADPFATVKHALSVATAGDQVFITSGTYTEEFPLTVPAGVSVRGTGIRSVKIVPSTATRYNDAFLLNGETIVEDLTVADFFSGGNYFTTTAVSSGSTTVNVGTAPFAHTYVSGGIITIGSTDYNITNAVYTHTTGVLVLTHTGGTAGLGDSVFVSNLTFSCNGSTNIFPDNGYAFRFASDMIVTSRSPYIRNCTIITKGSVTSPTDTLGFDAGDAGRGALVDGAYANASSKEASLLFHSVTFITPGVDCIVAKNGVRIEWLNCFSYFANKGFYLLSSNYGFAQQGQTRLRIDTRSGTWASGNTVTYYDTDGTTVLATGTISSINGNYVNLTGKCLGFETITDRVGKTVYAQGSAKLSTLTKKFGTASLALDGINSYASISPQPDFNFGTEDFTIECWIYPTAVPTAGQYAFVAGQSKAGVGNSSCGLSLGSAAGVIYLYSFGTFGTINGAAIAQNAWSHIALTREGNNFKLWINGTQAGSTLVYAGGMTSATTTNFTIGGNAGFNLYVTGYIDDVRVSKGVCRYTGTFAAPTSALTGDLNTVLLLHFNGVNNSTSFLDDGVTRQDLRTSAGGTASLINFADYSDFGAEVRSIGSASIYGNYGIYGDGDGVLAYLISSNFAYIGAGKLVANDPNDRIEANEVVKINRAKIYYTSVDNEGNFKVGDSFYVNQKTGEVLFSGQQLSVTSLNGVTFSDGVNTTVITASEVTTGNITITGNTIQSNTGDINVTAYSGQINLQNNTAVTGDLDVTNNLTINGNTTLGNTSGDTINFVGKINTDLIPATNNFYNLGSSSLNLRWKDAFLNTANINGITINSNVIAGTGTNADLELVANGTGRIYVPNNDVQINQDLTVTNDLTVTSGTTYLKNTSITGTITQTGNIDQTGNFTTSGNTSVTGNITGTGYLQLPQITINNNSIATTTTNTDLELVANGTGNVVVEGLKIQDNNIQVVNANTDLVLTPQGTGVVNISTTKSLRIPVGTTAERPPTPAVGMVRYNTDLSRYEGWSGAYWQQLSGVIDIAGNTYITPELTPGASDNTIRFYVNNVVKATLDSTKLTTSRIQTDNINIQDNTISTTVSGTDINLTTTGAGGVKIGSLKIRNNTITNVVSGAITEFVQSGTGYVKIAGTGGVVIPSGDTENDRPGIVEVGMMRFNTVLQLVEVYDGVSWGSVAGASGGVTAAEASDIGITTVLTFG